MKLSDYSDLLGFDFIRVKKADNQQDILEKINLGKPNYIFCQNDSEVSWISTRDFLLLLHQSGDVNKVWESVIDCEFVDENVELDHLLSAKFADSKLLVLKYQDEIKAYVELNEHGRQQLQLITNLSQDNRLLNEKIEQKDEFLGILSHDIRNPLGIISVCCDYMLSLAENTDKGGKNKYVEFIKRIKTNAKRSTMLVHSMLELGKSKNAIDVQVEDVYLPEFLKLTVQNSQFLANSKGIELVCDDLEEITAPIDQKKIQQVIENLTGNAIKFTQRNKRIHYSLAFESIDGIDYACISVRDEGRGIPQEKIKTLFEKYSQGDQTIAKELGVGLGLFIVKQFTDLHQGKIDIVSKEGEGTTFVIKLPHAFKGSKSRPIDSNNLKILVADDDEDIRYLVQMVIADMGFDFIEAENGEVAFEKYQLHKPDLIISDIRMPKLDGLELLQKVKQLDAKIPYVLMSGYYDQTESNNIKKVFHPDLMVSKPFVREEFRELLAQNFLQNKKQ